MSVVLSSASMDKIRQRDHSNEIKTIQQYFPVAVFFIQGGSNVLSLKAERVTIQMKAIVHYFSV